MNSELRGLAADVQLATDMPWGVYSQRGRTWLFTSPGFHPPTLDSDYPDDGFVLCFAGSRTHVDAGDGEDAQRVLVAIADALAVLVMDELGRPWPDLEGIGVLEVELDDQGRVSWARNGQAVCTVGRLASAI